MSGSHAIALCTAKGSWIRPWVERLARELGERGHRVQIHARHERVDEPVDLVFLLGYLRIVEPEFLARHRHNLVVHESALPQGRGWSPLTWQILEGRSEIPITLFEAGEGVDDGRIYLQEGMRFEGHELLDEMRGEQGRRTVDLCLRFVDDLESVVAGAREQEGEPSHYPRRRPEDSRLDPDRTLAEQFDLLRVCDPERYPAFVDHRGRRYRITLTRADDDGDDPA